MDGQQYDEDTDIEEEDQLVIDDGSNPNVGIQWGVSMVFFRINF